MLSEKGVSSLTYLDVALVLRRGEQKEGTPQLGWLWYRVSNPCQQVRMLAFATSIALGARQLQLNEPKDRASAEPKAAGTMESLSSNRL